MDTVFTNYKSVLDFLYTQLPMFQRVGGAAYKKDLSNTIKLCQALGHPEKKFKSVHIAGTNGKGSCSHYLASILQEGGYKTGLYTSPHLKNFTERIKINGAEMTQEAVISFVNDHQDLIQEVKPSFFEITVAMAFDYFAREHVDIAVIEVGMGGRLDSTNVVQPEVSMITNISKDHQQWLGDSIAAIAGEKAGIIKPNTPIVISEWNDESAFVFRKKAEEHHASITFASDLYQCSLDDHFNVYSKNRLIHQFPAELLATYQLKNIPAVLAVCDEMEEKGFKLDQIIREAGVNNMVKNTGLKGRWQTLQHSPRIICDVGHNEAGVSLIVEQLKKESFDNLHIVWGTVNDKDISSTLNLLPKEAHYYFCQADIPRALSASELSKQAHRLGLNGKSYGSVNEGIEAAKINASGDDLIFVGGSTFVVAEISSL